MDLSIPPDQIPYFIHWSLDVRTLVYSVGIAVLTGLLFGLAPAIQASRADLQDAMKEGGRGTTGSRAWLRNALVVAEVALSLAAARRRVAVRAQLLQPERGDDRLRHDAAHDAAILHAEREIHDARIEDAACRGRDAPDRGPSRRPGGVRLEHDPAPAAAAQLANIVIDGRSHEKGRSRGLSSSASRRTC